MKQATTMHGLDLGIASLVASVADLRIRDAVTAALAVRPLNQPSDLVAAADLALAMLRAGPRELVGDENMPTREPQRVHERAGDYFRELLDAQDRDVMRARILRAVEAGAKHAMTPTLTPVVAAIREARAVTAGALDVDDVADRLANDDRDAVFLSAFDEAIARSAQS